MFRSYLLHLPTTFTSANIYLANNFSLLVRTFSDSESQNSSNPQKCLIATSSDFLVIKTLRGKVLIACWLILRLSMKRSSTWYQRGARVRLSLDQMPTYQMTSRSSPYPAPTALMPHSNLRKPAPLWDTSGNLCPNQLKSKLGVVLSNEHFYNILYNRVATALVEFLVILIYILQFCQTQSDYTIWWDTTPCIFLYLLGYPSVT